MFMHMYQIFDIWTSQIIFGILKQAQKLKNEL